MRTRTRLSMSADGFVTTPGGWPAIVADKGFVPGQTHGFAEFLPECEAALMGRATCTRWRSLGACPIPSSR